MRIFGRKIGKKFKQREFDSGSNDENKNNNGSKIIGIPENQKRTSRPKEEAAVVKSKSVKSVNSSNEATSTLKPRTGKEPAKVKQSKLGKKERKSLEKQVKSEKAAEFRAGKKAEFETAKKAQKDRASANTYNKGKALGTAKKPVADKVPMKKDPRPKAEVASGNKRATSNRTAKAGVKVGETYTYTSADGTKKKIKRNK